RMPCFVFFGGSRMERMASTMARPAIDAGCSSFRSELKTQWPFGGLHLGRMAPCRMRGEPVGLVCLSVHHKNIGVFMSHDLKAHALLPRWSLVSDKSLPKVRSSRLALRPIEMVTQMQHSYAIDIYEGEISAKRCVFNTVELNHNPRPERTSATVRGSLQLLDASCGVSFSQQCFANR